jgi:hypothetical protein
MVATGQELAAIRDITGTIKVLIDKRLDQL